MISERSFGIEKSLKALKTSERLICDKIEKELKHAVLTILNIAEEDLVKAKISE